MLDSETLALRIRDAMDNRKPTPVKAAELASAFGVTPQAINGWRKKGRIGKGRLLKLARLTGKPASYFLGDDIDESLEAQAFKLAEDWLTLKNPGHRSEVRALLDRYLDIAARFPQLDLEAPADEKLVERGWSAAGKPVAVKRER